MSLRTSGYLAVALALAACSNPHYEPESAAEVLPVPEAWTDAPAGRVAADTVCRDLGGASLAALEQRLAADSLELRSAVARLRQAEAVARGARSPLLPRLDLSITGSRGTAVGGGFLAAQIPEEALPPGLSGGGISEQYQGSLAASYEVDVWGRVRNEYRAATLQAEAAAESLTALEVSLGAQLADTWASLLAQRELIALLGEQVETSRKFLEVTRLRFGLGQSGAADVGRQRQQLQRLDGQLGVARGRERVLEHQLAALLGAPPDTFALPVDDRLPAVAALPDPGIPAALPEARPDVRAARLTLAARDRRLAAAIGDRLPALSLNASLLSIETMLEELFSDTLWRAGAELTANIFDFDQRRAIIDLRDAEAEEALVAYATALLDAWTEVATSLALAEARDGLVESLERQLAEAERVLVLTRTAYREGQVAFLDVLLALQSRQNLEQTLVDARRDQYSSRIQLCRALGISLLPGESV
ncbi:MAG: TolC family protein [Gammaproteobacteria bacterium]